MGYKRALQLGLVDPAVILQWVGLPGGIERGVPLESIGTDCRNDFPLFTRPDDCLDVGTEVVERVVFVIRRRRGGLEKLVGTAYA